jgi:hypothetical protein
MHLGCLGVMRRFLLYWKGPIGPLQVRLGPREVIKLSNKLLSFVAYIPCEFSRKPRALRDIMRWKATEFRLFLLYLGPIALSNILPEPLLKHFMMLHVACRILTSRQFKRNWDYANQLLVNFVGKASTLYGRECLVYNVHSLVHLAADVNNLGPLENFSSFPFENMLGSLKRLIRKPNQPIQQLVKRLAEKQLLQKNLTSNAKCKYPKLTQPHFDGPLLISDDFIGKQFLKLQTPKWHFSTSDGNNCFMLKNGNMILVRNILEVAGRVRLLCQQFNQTFDAFISLMPSLKVNILKAVNNDFSALCEYQLSDIACKCICVPDVNDTYFITPFLHSF